jgi:type VI secretion system protein ImpH
MASNDRKTPTTLAPSPDAWPAGPSPANAIPSGGAAGPPPFLARVFAEIGAQPYNFDFFHALRLVQCGCAAGPRLGASKSPEQDPVRFCQRPSLAFAAATLEELERGTPPKLYVNFFGLFGPNGPLPLHLTDYALRRQMGQKPDVGADEARGLKPEKRDAGKSEETSFRRDNTFPAFADVFHHRLISLFFRAWACNQQTVDFDRQEDQRFPFYIGSSFGLASETNERGEFHPHSDALPAGAKLYYAGRLACPTRNAEGLEAILADYFGVAAQVQTFQGRWLDLPEENRCRLGHSPDTGTLGVSAIAGSRIWDCQLAFRVRLGPMQLADFTRFLPGSRSLARLTSWVANYAGAQYFWDLQVLLAAAEVPSAALAFDRPAQMGRLGWTTWLKSQPFERDSEDMILNPA